MILRVSVDLFVCFFFFLFVCFFVFQAEDGIRDLVRSRGLGDVYKRQEHSRSRCPYGFQHLARLRKGSPEPGRHGGRSTCHCLLYTSDAADERSSVDLGGRRIIKKKKKRKDKGRAEVASTRTRNMRKQIRDTK